MDHAGIGLDEHSVIDLTTVGRVTGRLHRIEIWFAQKGATLYMLSGGGDHSDWVRNLIAEPAVMVRAGDADYPGRGRLVHDAAEQRVARDAVFNKYVFRYGGDLTGWRESSLPVAIDLVRPQASS